MCAPLYKLNVIEIVILPIEFGRRPILLGQMNCFSLCVFIQMKEEEEENIQSNICELFSQLLPRIMIFSRWFADLDKIKISFYPKSSVMNFCRHFNEGKTCEIPTKYDFIKWWNKFFRQLTNEGMSVTVRRSLIAIWVLSWDFALPIWLDLTSLYCYCVRAYPHHAIR